MSHSHDSVTRLMTLVVVNRELFFVLGGDYNEKDTIMFRIYPRNVLSGGRRGDSGAETGAADYQPAVVSVTVS